MIKSEVWKSIFSTIQEYGEDPEFFNLNEVVDDIVESVERDEVVS